MGEVLKIFISATSADLGAARRAAVEFFNRHPHYKPVEQEDRESVPATLLVNDRRQLAECHAVLHIVGECYGAEPAAGAERSEGGEGAELGGERAVVPGAGGQRRSYTQREYDHARALGKPLYLFVCEETFPYDQHKPETRKKQALQRAHREAILAGEHRYERIADFAALDTELRNIHLAPQRLDAKLGRTRRRDALIGPAVKKVGRKIDKLADKLATADPLQRYYQNLREQFANYDNVGLPVPAREGKEEKEEPIKIRDLFVPPHCSAQHIRPAEFGTEVPELGVFDAKRRLLGEPLLPLLANPPPGNFILVRTKRVVLLADPGMGKSTVVQYLIATLADEKEPVGAPELRGAVPFPFILRELVRLLPDDVKKWNWDALLDAFCRWDPRNCGEGALAAAIADRVTFRSLVAGEHSFFLIDGLDEIGDPEKRVAIRDAIWEGFERFPHARWLITSRIVGYDLAVVHESVIEFPPLSPEVLDRRAKQFSAIGAHANLFTESGLHGSVHQASLLYLAPFNDTQQRAFAEHWYMPRMGEAKGAGRAREFIAAVHQHPHTRVIGRIPNLLYLLALLYRHQAQLPHGRALVYEAISEAYLESIPLQRLLLGEAAAYSQSFPVKEQLLAIVGMKMQQLRASRQEGEDGDILVSRDQLGEWLAGRFDSEAAVQEFLDHVARHSGLLLPRGEGVYGFAHLSFQEYYAACHLRSDFERIVTAKARPAGGLLRRPAPAAGENEERLFAEYAAQPVWHEPLLFLVEKFRGNKDFTAQLLEWMFPQLVDEPAKGNDWMPYRAAQLLATLSIDPEVALELPQRVDLWRALWQADCVAWNWRIAPSLMVGGNVFQTEVLQAAAALSPRRLKLDECTALSDLAPLAGLTSLEELSLNNCTALRVLAPRLTGLRQLDLGGCTALIDITVLAGLAGLQKLYLGDCTALGEITALAGLTGLRILDLRRCTALSDLTPLAGLTCLQELKLKDCTALSDLTPLSSLISLQQLDLRRCIELSDLTPLAGLTDLRTLYLDRCTGLGEEEVAKLRKALPNTYIAF
jgi:hypothetical protein